jgi:hypothetical protein
MPRVSFRRTSEQDWHARPFSVWSPRKSAIGTLRQLAALHQSVAIGGDADIAIDPRPLLFLQL